MSGNVAVLTADYFTDPLCSWSWSNEPSYRKLRAEFGDQIRWRHRMGALTDAVGEDLYDVRRRDVRALHEHWRAAAGDTLAPIDNAFWTDGGPRSLLLAPLAVKAAALQGFAPADQLLRRLREAALCERKSLDRVEEILAVAGDAPDLNTEQLARDLGSDRAQEAFLKDFQMARRPLSKARDTKATDGHVRYGYPSLVLRSGSEVTVLDADHAPDEYMDTVISLAPDLRRAGPPTATGLSQMFRTLTTQEVEVVAELASAEALAQLKNLVNRGRLSERNVAGKAVWDRQ